MLKTLTYLITNFPFFILQWYPGWSPLSWPLSWSTLRSPCSAGSYRPPAGTPLWRHSLTRRSLRMRPRRQSRAGPGWRRRMSRRMVRIGTAWYEKSSSASCSPSSSSYRPWPPFLSLRQATAPNNIYLWELFCPFTDTQKSKNINIKYLIGFYAKLGMLDISYCKRKANYKNMWIFNDCSLLFNRGKWICCWISEDRLWCIIFLND